MTKRGSSSCRSKLTETDVETIWSLYASGVNQSEISRRFKVSNNTIHNIVKNRTWKHVPRLATIDPCMTHHINHARGSRIANAKLTERDVKKILELHAAGVTRGTLENRFQVSRAQINRIISGELWKHVPR